MQSGKAMRTYNKASDKSDVERQYKCWSTMDESDWVVWGGRLHCIVLLSSLLGECTSHQQQQQPQSHIVDHATRNPMRLHI